MDQVVVSICCIQMEVEVHPLTSSLIFHHKLEWLWFRKNVHLRLLKTILPLYLRFKRHLLYCKKKISIKMPTCV